MRSDIRLEAKRVNAEADLHDGDFTLTLSDGDGGSVRIVAGSFDALEGVGNLILEAVREARPKGLVDFGTAYRWAASLGFE